MARPTSATLEEIRRSVQDRIGGRANADQRLVNFLNEEIRGAHTRLYRRHWWARRRLVIPIDLIQNQHVYDIPDQLAPEFEFVWIEDDNNRITEMFQEVPRPAERDALLRPVDENGDPVPSAPFRYWIENDALNIGPYPDTEVWKRLVVQGMEREIEVDRDGHRIRIDKELLLMHVVRAARDAYGEDTSKLVNDIQQYEADLRGDAAERDAAFQMGEDNYRHYNKSGPPGMTPGLVWHPGNRLYWTGGSRPGAGSW